MSFILQNYYIPETGRVSQETFISKNPKLRQKQLKIKLKIFITEIQNYNNFVQQAFNSL